MLNKKLKLISAVILVFFLKPAMAEPEPKLSLCKTNHKLAYAHYIHRTERWLCSTNRNPQSITLSGCRKLHPMERHYCIISDFVEEAVISTKPPVIKRCAQKIQWFNNTKKVASYDGANCFVYKLPSNVSPFVYDNKYYIKPNSPQVCSLGKWDGANCWLGTAPHNKKAFLYDRNFYYKE